MRRIESLVDENSFVELMSLVTARSTDFNLNPTEAPSDGVIIGHGLIDGNLVFIYSQDETVLGGTIGEMHAKKVKYIYDMAVKMGAPVISIIDSKGVRLQESFDSLSALGSIYSSCAKASGVVPEISCVVGECGGGISILSSLSDFSFMTKDAHSYLNSPDAIKGNNIDLMDSSSSDFQSEGTGIYDVLEDEDEMFSKVRELISLLPGTCDEGYRISESEDDLNRASDIESKLDDPILMLNEIADDNSFFEVRKNFGSSMITGLMSLGNTTVGVIANNSEELTACGVKKASMFIRFLDAFDIPLLSLCNVKGYERSLYAEKNLPFELSTFVSVLSESDIPKISLVTKNAYGSASILMNSKALGCDLTYAFNNSDMGIIDSDKAALIICPDEDEEERENVSRKFHENCQGVENAARRGVIDRIINPIDARKYLIAGFEMLYTKREKADIKKHSSK
ncbi:MAG: carboxyl transferase [Lachnospiraceae bacterium]|nr:carboxyl transferase [Lachnospiraceae bacterium]